MIKRLTLYFASFALFCMGAVSHAQTLTVSAAASLSDAFTEIGQAFEKEHPDTKVAFNFAAAGALLQQIVQGAPVDVFVSADQEIMNKAQAQDVIQTQTRVNFTANTLVLITPKESALSLHAVEDLTAPEVKLVVLGNPSITPIGRYVRDELQKRNLWTSIESKLVLAETVRQSLNYVSRGEVDAGFVFATDARTLQDKVKIAFSVSPGQDANPFVYPIAVTAQSKNSLSAEFIAFVLSAEGQTILSKYGFVSVQ